MQYGGKNTLVVTDGRRSVEAYRQGIYFNQQWSDMAFSPSDELRVTGGQHEDTNIGTIDEIMADPERKRSFIHHIEGSVNNLITGWQIPASDPRVARALEIMFHIKWHEEDGKIKVDNIDTLLEDLKAYYDVEAKKRFERNTQPRKEGIA